MRIIYKYQVEHILKYFHNRTEDSHLNEAIKKLDRSLTPLNLNDANYVHDLRNSILMLVE